MRRIHRFGLLVLAILAFHAAPLAAADSTASVQLQRVLQSIVRQPQAAAATTLAAHVSQEGHWTFLNLAGETFTAATPEEARRAVDVLLPGREGRRLTIHLTGDSVFLRGDRLAELPADSDLVLAWGDGSYRLKRPGSRGPVMAEIKPDLLLELGTEAAFVEAQRQLSRPLDRQAFRVLNVTAAGPHTLSRTPRIDKASGRVDTDSIDPAYLVAALASVRGQTAVLVGRLTETALIAKPSSGPEVSLNWRELVAAATAADVNLLVLKAASGQQPGDRNWLWQKVEVKGFESALGHATMADFFDALGGPNNRLLLSVRESSGDRIVMDLSPSGAVPSTQSTTAQIGSYLSDIVAGLAGRVTHQGALAHFRSTARDDELARRLLPFLPSAAQWLYGVAIVLGLVGLPIAWRWWAHVWPPEVPAEYPTALGLWAARGIRGVVFGLIFLPLVSVVAGPAAMMGWFGLGARRVKVAR